MGKLRKKLREKRAEAPADAAPRKLKKKKKRVADAAPALDTTAAPARTPLQKKKKKKKLVATVAEGAAQQSSPQSVVAVDAVEKNLKRKRWMKKMEAAGRGEEALALVAKQAAEAPSVSEKLSKKKKAKKKRRDADAEVDYGSAHVPKDDSKNGAKRVFVDEGDAGAAQGEAKAPRRNVFGEIVPDVSTAWETKAPAADDKNARKVFVGGVPFATAEEDLKGDFEECGEIEHFVCLKGDDGSFKGMAFITYKNKEGVEAALAYDGTDYGGRSLKVSMATPRGAGKGDGKAGGKDKNGKDGQGKDGKGKDGKGKDGKGKDSKGKDGKDGKGKGKDKDKGKGKQKGKDSGKGNKSFGFEMGSDDDSYDTA